MTFTPEETVYSISRKMLKQYSAAQPYLLQHNAATNIEDAYAALRKAFDYVAGNIDVDAEDQPAT